MLSSPRATQQSPHPLRVAEHCLPGAGTQPNSLPLNVGSTVNGTEYPSQEEVTN